MENRYYFLSIFIIIIMLLMPCKSLADIYKWVDEEGVIHFTDDISKIPLEYRKKAERKIIPEGKREAGAHYQPSEIEPLEKKIEINQKSRAMSEEDWKSAFERLSQQIRAGREEIERKKAFMREVERRRNMAFYIPNRIVSDEDAELYEKYKKEVPEQEKRIEDLERQLTELREKAKKAGIPESIFEVR